MDSGVIDYKSEYDYYSRKIRAGTAMSETELHKYNQAILNSSYSEWNFAIVVMEAEGDSTESNWKRLK